MSDMHDGRATLYALGALPPGEAAQFEQHLAGCPSCRDEVDHTRDTTARLSASVAVAPPARLRAAVMSRIADTPQEQAAAEPAHDVTSPEPEANEPAPTAVLHRQPHRPGRGRSGWGRSGWLRTGWRRVSYLVAAVAVLVALAGAGWAVQAHRAVQAAAQQSRLIARVVSAPDTASRSASMPGGGRGTVLVSQSRDEALFVASGLPDLAGGRVYQLWTLHGKQATSAGLVRPGQSTVAVALPAAALTASAVAVTEEPAGGSAQPSGKPVMAFPLS